MSDGKKFLLFSEKDLVSTFKNNSSLSFFRYSSFKGFYNFLQKISRLNKIFYLSLFIAFQKVLIDRIIQNNNKFTE